MSGTEANNANLDLLEAVLDRQTSIESLSALFSAVDRKPKKIEHFEKVAIGIDASVFLRLAIHRNSVDIVDYLGSRHQGPLILPGQAIQEYWNNQYAVIPSVAAAIQKRFDALKQDSDKLGPNFPEYAAQMEGLLDQFSSDFGYVFDASTIGPTVSLLTLLKDRAALSYVPRVRFCDIALSRKRTKTPPGFKDDGDGDFYLWAEFLYGLLNARDAGQEFTHAVILTHDKKTDWSRDGIAHPILMAEVERLVGVPFDVLTIDQFFSEISSKTTVTPKAKAIAVTTGETTTAAGEAAKANDESPSSIQISLG